MSISETDKAKLSAQHGELLHLQTKWGDEFLFRAATPEEYERFQVEHADITTRISGTRTLLRTCCVYPGPDAPDEFLKRKPGALWKLATPLSAHCGAEDDAVRKK